MTPHLLRTSILLSALVVVVRPQACTLDCESNTPCTFTTEQDLGRFDSHAKTVDGKPFDWHQIPSINGMHCLCPHGLTGVRCQVPFETCDGNHQCYNGGACVPGLLDSFGNDQLFCNCESAFDKDGYRYVGKYCETKEENYCDDSLTFFCLNAGTCNPNFPGSGEPCDCLPNFFGEHCEYLRDQVSEIECVLDCKNGGTCIVGEKPDEQNKGSLAYWSQTNNTSQIDHMHCSCPNGYDGELCEIPREPCGDDYCFHGGKCMTRQVDGQILHHCDCSKASTDDASYAGRFCQFKATSYCTKDLGLNGHLFCVNGGTCQVDAHLGCKCKDDFAGFSCEFVKSEFNAGTSGQTTTRPADTPETYTCDLACENGGVCRIGIKDMDFLGDITDNAPHLGQDETGEFMHCICPDGFAGPLCQQEVKICGQGEHLCFHGSDCVKDGDDDACDCSTTTSSLAENFAGKHCEHPIDDICTVDLPGPAQPLLFCVNGGKCIEYVMPGTPHPGCSCELGFTGPHCEISSSTQTIEGPDPERFPASDPKPTNLGGVSGEDSSSNSGSIVAVTVLTIGLLGVIIVSYFMASVYMKRQRQQQDTLTENLRWASNYRDQPPELNLSPRRASIIDEGDYPVSEHASSTDPFVTHLAPRTPPSDQEDLVEPEPQIYIGPPRDEDGHELHNVEIL